MGRASSPPACKRKCEGGRLGKTPPPGAPSRRRGGTATGAPKGSEGEPRLSPDERGNQAREGRKVTSGMGGRDRRERNRGRGGSGG